MSERPVRAIQRVGVIGAGVIGRGVAQSCSGAGLDVVLVDRSAGALRSAMEQIDRERRRMVLFGRGAEQGGRMGEILTTESMDDIKDCDFVVENITENVAEKLHIHAAIDEVCPKDVVVAANTSAISITKIASRLSAPGRVLGIHFMNPVPLIQGVELIPGARTTEWAMQGARCFLAILGKNPIEVSDAPGFVSNRVLMLSVNEAAFLIYEGVATVENVDKVFVNCFGHPMGMLETADLIGIDTVLMSIEALHEQFLDSKYRPCPLLRRMVDAGRLGRKSGGGFYDYFAGEGHGSGH